ncbi:16S rRNA (uracil(1498)-N(3))-methyltransferase [Bacillus alveayuensis]|jgi:16S rRNA (uracil1498-N3)-methyltransferase|uniref:16S rRNA (uracil(1498)-N(3))-methyltransferase n=1 Tax=Aeribacillus alveayuensis TaxID=279215 RepID=UPI0005CD562C|nr:16S rRNA (uracil(1498)-N(3))-methyltransferase [Bacillus alveayuensis]
MQRYFVDQFKDEMKNKAIITGDDVHHISRVMRMKKHDQVICCSKDGYTAMCEIEHISNDQVTCIVLKWMEMNNELPVRVQIASGLPKGDKLEWIIQKGTELGAAQFIPFIAARSIVKLDAKKAEKKKERWRKIAKEAAEQSHRNAIPTIDAPVTFQELLKRSKSADLKLVAYEESAKKGESSSLYQALSSLLPGQTIIVVFGPEGGMTEDEIRQLEQVGFISCGFGPRILRTETAPLYLLSAISYHFEIMR